MKTIVIKIKATAPMIMNSDKLVDPFLPESKKLKEMTDDRTFKATDEGKLAIAKHKYINAFYLTDKGKVCLPSLNIRKSLIEGARLSKGGKEIERGVVFPSMKTDLEYKGPKDPESLWERKEFVDARPVVVGRSKIMAYRPLFVNWSAMVEVIYAPEIINPENLMRYWEQAGAFIGIGDFRPLFGRYEVEPT